MDQFTKEEEAILNEMGTSPTVESDEKTEATEDVGTSQEMESSEETASEDIKEGTETEPEWKTRFKTPEETWKGFREAESAYGRSQSELANLRRQVEELRQAQKQTTESNDSIARFKERAAVDPYAAIREAAAEEARRIAGDVRSETAALKFSQAYIQARQDPEFVELEPLMVEIANEWKPYLEEKGIAQDPAILNVLKLVAKGRAAELNATKIKNTAKKQGELSALKKTKAKIEGGSGSKGKDKTFSDDMPLDEMEKELRRLL